MMGGNTKRRRTLMRKVMIERENKSKYFEVEQKFMKKDISLEKHF